MKTGKPIRWAIVGTSFVSDWMAEAIIKSGEGVLAAVCSRCAERGAAFAQKQGGALVFEDYASLLQCGEIDAVYLASPNMLHYSQTLAALRAGKHVFCEKPLALNGKQAQAMVAEARSRGLVLLEAIRPVYDPFLRAVQETLERVGPIHRAAFEFCQYSSRYGRYLAGEHVNIFDAALGNAALLDLGVYCAHCCAALFGRPKRVRAASSYLENGTEIGGTALLEYDHLQATLAYSKITESISPSQIQGEAGTIAFDSPNQPSYVRFYPRRGQAEEIPYPKAENNMVFELAAFGRCLRGEEDPKPYQEQSLAAMAILDAIRADLGLSFGELESL